MYGLWVWLFGVYITTDTHRHDFNDELGDGKLFDGWDWVENKWEQYAHQVFGVEEESGEDMEDEGTVPRKPVKGKRWLWFTAGSKTIDRFALWLPLFLVYLCLWVEQSLSHVTCYIET